MTDQDGQQQTTMMNDFSADSAIIENEDVFDPDNSLPEMMPEREDELTKIHRALAPVARGSSPKNRLIFGKPGQGKTAAVQLKRRQMKHQLSDEDSPDTTFIYISCMDNPSSYDVSQAILKKLCDYSSKPKGYQLSELYDQIYAEMREIGGAFIILLDEVDSIHARNSKYDDPNEPNILYKFPRSNSSQSQVGSDNQFKIGLFGISNDREFRKNLTSRCMDALGETSINFKPYNEEQLMQILMRRASRGLKKTQLDIVDGEEYRFESEVIDEDMLRECATMAAQERGSARQALRYLGGAASIADSRNGEVITEEDIQKSESEVRQEFVRDVLTDHTKDEWLAFTGVLWCKAVGKTPAKLPEIHDHYSSVASVLDERAKVQRRMTDRLRDLELTGAIDMPKKSGGQRGGEYFAIELLLPFGETLDVMQHDEPFADEFSDVIAEIRDHAERNAII